MKKILTPKKPLTIAKTGVAHGSQTINLSESLLSDVAASYDPAVYAAPLVKGHPELDAPRYGTVATVQFADEALHADTDKVDADFAEEVNSGAFPYISMSVWKPGQPANPKPDHWYLKHVGFLGAVPPAVKGQTPAVFEFAEGDDDGVLTFAFDSYSEHWIARLFRNIREHIIASDGTEAADRVIPDHAVEQLITDSQTSAAEGSASFAVPSLPIIPPKKSIEDLPMPIDAAEAQRLQDENKALKAQVATAAAEKAQREQQAAHANHVSFCAELVQDGQLPPAQQAVTVAVLDALNTVDNASLNFSEGESEQPLYEAYKATLAAAPAVDFAEFAEGQEAHGRLGNDSDPLLADAKARNNT